MNDLTNFMLAEQFRPLRGFVKVNGVYQLGVIRRGGDHVGARGELAARKIFPDGREESWIVGRNKIVDVGLSALCHVLSGISTEFNTYKIDDFAIGQGTTPETAADTDLEAKLYGAAPSIAFPTVNTREGKVQFTITIPQGTPSGATVWAVTEAGLRASAAPNKLVTRKVFAPINKDSSFALQLIWTITLTQTP